jgi:hypothetical protein
MSALLAFILSNPTILGIGAAIIAALGFGFQQRLAGAKAERNSQKAKEADAYAQHIKEISDAANARPSGSVLNDPNNRDRA